MARIDLIALLPLVVTGLASVALMGLIAIRRSHGLAAGFTAASLVAALVSLAPARRAAPRAVDPLFVVDGYGLFFVGVIVVTALLVTVMAYAYFTRQRERPEEFFILLLLAVTGSGILTLAASFVSLFLGLEILSVALYVLIAYPRLRTNSVEAAVKYLVLGSASAAFLLFGAALAYARLGTMDLQSMATALAQVSATADPVLLAGTALVIVGAAFKLGVVPFHLWAPDVYQGAPAPVGALIATISKASMVALVFRYFGAGQDGGATALAPAVALIGAASMFAGNILALLQTNLKRLLAYSSISHLGYVLVALVAPTDTGREAAAYYMAAYAVTLVAAFGVMAAISDGQDDVEEIDRYRGLFWRRPWLAVALTASMLSLAGIPLTAGFVGKFYVLLAGASGALWTLVLILAVTSVIGLYYYLRVVVALYADETSAVAGARELPSSVATSFVLTTSTLAIFCLGVFPQPIMRMLSAAIAEWMG